MAVLPTLLLADEPVADPDSQNYRIIFSLFQRLNRNLRQTIVIVFHEEWRIRYFDQIIFLKDSPIGMEGRGGVGGERAERSP